MRTAIALACLVFVVRGSSGSSWKLDGLLSWFILLLAFAQDVKELWP